MLLVLAATSSPAGGAMPSWVVSPTPDRGPGGNVLYAVSASGRQDVWAVGRWTTSSGYWHPLIEHHTAKGWRVIEGLGIPPSDLSLLTGIVAVTPRDAWAVGADLGTARDNVLIEHWNGKGWRRYPSTAGFGKLVDIDRAPRGRLWAVGGFAGDKQLAAHWDGSRWTFMRLAAPRSFASSMSVNAVAAVADDDVWAVGSDSDLDIVSCCPGRSFASHWDGSRWTVVPTPRLRGSNSPALLGASHVPGSGQVWAVGFVSHNGYRTPLTERYANGRWQIVPSPHPGRDSLLTDVTAVGPQNVWAVGTWLDGTRVVSLVEHFSHGRWTVVDAPNIDGSDTSLIGAAVIPPGARAGIWAVGLAVPSQRAPSTTFAIHTVRGVP